MIELRKDYVLNRWVIIAAERKKRPRDFIKQSAAVGQKVCVFCPENESMTPKEIGRINDAKGKWKIRWFPNLYPAAREEGQREVRTDNTFFTFASAYGSHEVIVETPSHEKQLWDFSAAELREVLVVYKERIEQLSRKESIKYAALFKNHGPEGGTSLAHSHTQIMSINIPPPLIEAEAAAYKNHSGCPYCSIINIEKNSFRRCFENSLAVAFTPYASRFNFEIWLFPKRHLRSMSEMTPEELAAIADLLQKALSKLKELNAPYNFVFHYAPDKSNLHFHIEVLPRIATWAGFEFATDIIINSVSPEDAAAFYRGEAE